MKFRAPSIALLVTASCGGGGSPSGARIRSPSLDYPPPPAQTADGDVLGADRVPPGDKLATGARIGPGGFTPAHARPEAHPHPKPAGSAAPPPLPAP